MSDDTAVSDILEVCRASLSRLILIKPIELGCICNKSMQQQVTHLPRHCVQIFPCVGIVQL